MIGKSIIELGSVDSTNTYAGNILQKSDPEDGTVIWALKQSGGRGLNENKWESEPGKNLTFSIILCPGFLPPDRQFQLNKAISLGVFDFLNSLIPNLTIKWPNDIYVGVRKIAGILIENRIIGTRIKNSIAGIGININQTSFPHDIPNPVSLSQVLRYEIDLKEALINLCKYMDSRYSQLRSGDHIIIDHDYHHCLLGRDEWRIFTKRGKNFEGKIEGVDDYGHLLITDRKGTRSAFNLKEVEFHFDP